MKKLQFLVHPVYNVENRANVH